VWTGSMWECPVLLRGPDGDALLVSVHDDETTHHPLAIIGQLDGTRFVPRALQRVDLGPDLYAPCLLPQQDGSAVLWAWSWEARSTEQQRTEGWAGMLTAPRRVEVVGDGLRLSPIPQLAGLRERQLTVERRATADGWLADGVDGDALDLELDLGPAADRIELRLRRAPQLEEVTTVVIDRAAGALWLDRDRASLDREVTGGCVGGRPSLATAFERVRVLLDRSIVEVFLDDAVVLTARIYPSCADSTGVEVVGTPTAVADVTLRAWTLGSIWATDADAVEAEPPVPPD
jgi:beta-fructofuranosidase